MAKIPVQVGNRSLETGSVIQYPNGDPIGKAVEGVGTQVAQAGNNWRMRLDARNEQVERFQTLQKFDQFGTEIQVATDKAKQELEPGAPGLHDKLVKNFDERSAEWLTKVPPALRPEFEARVQTKRAEYARGAAVLENTEAKRFQTSTIDQRVTTAKQGILQTGPDTIAQYTRDVDELIDNAPSISPAERDEAKRKIRQDLQATGFTALAERDPKAAQNAAKGWGFGGAFSGSAQDRAMQLLRDKEGFRAGTYYDVNADRVGYGSDTITDAQGNVRQVKQGDTVTREDAERDLRRRTGETLGGIKTAVGDEAFSRLNPNQQAALASVAYNYGTLPASVQAAVKSGDAEGIARSIEGLQGHNNGVNRTRRLSEAALARSGGGDGPVQGVYQPDPRFADLTAEQRMKLAGYADLEAKKAGAAEAAIATQDYNNRLNNLQTQIIDNKATLADVEVARKEGWLTDAGDIQKLIGQIATRDKKTADVTAFGQAFGSDAFGWNPVNKDHKDYVEAGYTSMGKTPQALQTIVDRTGIVPESAVVSMRGGLVSNNPQQVEQTLQIARNLVMGKNPNILSVVEGGKDLTDAALTFDQLVYGRGMPAADAARRIMEERTPEYEQKIKAKIKKEDVDQVVKKNLTDNDIRGAFNPSFLGLAPNPQLSFGPEMRQRAMGDYESSFRDHFQRNGDVALSKRLSLEEMKRTWGVSQVSGSSVVMKFPPDRSPAYAGIENVGEHVAAQAITAIKDLNGVDVERSKLRIDEARHTGERYMRGEPPTYIVSYTDKNGIVQTIPKPFFADPALMRDEQTAKRAAESAKIQARVNIDADMADLRRAPLGVAP